MILWICLALTLVVVVLVFIGSIRVEGIASGIDIAAAFAIIGAMVTLLVVGVAIGVTESLHKTPVEVIVKEYEVAEGSKISIDRGTLEFIYVEDGVPEKFSEFVRPVEILGSGETVTITTEHFEHGTGVVPWGHGYEAHSAVVK